MYHVPQLVNLHSLRLWMTERYFLCLHYSRGKDHSSSTCCYGVFFVYEGGTPLWATVGRRLLLTLPPGVLTSVRTGTQELRYPVTRRVQTTHGPFHCIAPSLTSGAQSCCRGHLNHLTVKTLLTADTTAGFH